MKSLQEMLDELEGGGQAGGSGLRRKRTKRGAAGKDAGESAVSSAPKGSAIDSLVSFLDGQAEKKRSEAMSADAGLVAAGVRGDPGKEHADREKAAKEHREQVAESERQAQMRAGAAAAAADAKMESDRAAAAVRAEREMNRGRAR